MADRKTTRKTTPKAVSKGKRKAASKKAATKKPARKAASKKAATKKLAQKAVSKKAAPKVAAKKAATKKAATKKASSKKAAPKAPARKKASVKKKLAARASMKNKRKPREAAKKMPVPRAIAVGDAVMLPAGVLNQIRRYDAHATLGGRGTEAVSGLVCSIRQVATGKFTAKTRGDLEGYVLEILHSRTFQTQFSSKTNTGGAKSSEVVSDNPSWSRLRSLLKQQAESKQLASYGSGNVAREVFGTLLDGWRLVKMKAEFVLRED
ncbi:MAG: hypothetical protein IMF16_00795 [Proteobacteria bacterium]|nr:hypothetical protein [Pseudomonadota bacterium]